MPTNVQFQGSAQRLTKRRISEETCQHYKVGLHDGDHTCDGYTEIISVENRANTSRVQNKDKTKRF